MSTQLVSARTTNSPKVTTVVIPRLDSNEWQVLLQAATGTSKVGFCFLMERSCPGEVRCGSPLYLKSSPILSYGCWGEMHENQPSKELCSMPCKQQVEHNEQQTMATD